ncbi:MAG TPA: polysaccharide deacetylase family protein [Verrucomicrobiae bacterium]|nr:polysaccharide deacetylase family protein [Verrucomicrobiae bacterium]
MRVITFNRPRYRSMILLGIILTAFLAYQDVANLHVFSQKLKPIYSVETDKKEVAITFDISWGEDNVLPVLEILNREGVKATFFLSGPWAKKYPNLVKSIVNGGHEIASHGNRHIDLNTLGKQEIIAELKQADKDLQEVSGKKPSLIRTPNGAYDNKVIESASAVDYRVIQWSVDSLDWKRPGPQAVINNVLNGHRPGQGVKPGAIILFHASNSAPDTVSALPVVLKKLKEQGYSIMPVGDLLSHGTGTWPPESKLSTPKPAVPQH